VKRDSKLAGWAGGSGRVVGGKRDECWLASCDEDLPPMADDD
jgi:hypothetical protein